MTLTYAPATTTPLAHRSGRRTRTRCYRVEVGGYEPLFTATGEPLSTGFVVESFRVEVPNTYLGFGTRDAIFAAAALRFPGKDVLEFNPVRRAIAA